MKQKKIRFNVKPLQASISIVPVGSIAARQTYSFDTAEFAPDYELTPLVLQPLCSIMDRDGLIPSGSVNASLTNMQWKEGKDDQSNIISPDSPHYEITDSGANKGRIKVKRNIDIVTPLTLYFYAEYVDPRNNQRLVFRDSHQVICVNESPAVPVLKLDVPETVFYNPWEDPVRLTIKATMMLDNEIITETARRKFWWYKQLQGTIRLFDPELDPELVSVSDDTIVIDREYMGDEVGIVCKGEYSTSDRPMPADPTNSALTDICTVCRQLPNYEYDYSGVPGQIAADQLTMNPKLIVQTNKGIVSQPMSVLRATWYTKKSTAGATWVAVAHGASPSISTTAINDSTGKSIDLGVKVEDRGPLCILTDKDGNELTDQNGNVLWGN